MVFSSSRSVAILLLSTAANVVVAETYLKEQFNDAVSHNAIGPVYALNRSLCALRLMLTI
jgi:hypothetical protein